MQWSGLGSFYSGQAFVNTAMNLRGIVLRSAQFIFMPTAAELFPVCGSARKVSVLQSP